MLGSGATPACTASVPNLVFIVCDLIFSARRGLKVEQSSIFTFSYRPDLFFCTLAL